VRVVCVLPTSQQYKPGSTKLLNGTAVTVSVSVVAASSSRSTNPTPPFCGFAMRGMLGTALRNAAASPPEGADEATLADAAILKRLQKKQALKKISATVKHTVDVSQVLEEPALPSKRDLDRWWPEAKRETPNPLVEWPRSLPLKPGSAILPAAAATGPLPSPGSPGVPPRTSQSSFSLTRSISLPNQRMPSRQRTAATALSGSRGSTLGTLPPSLPIPPRTSGGFGGQRQRPRPRGGDPSRTWRDPKAITVAIPPRSADASPVGSPEAAAFAAASSSPSAHVSAWGGGSPDGAPPPLSPTAAGAMQLELLDRNSRLSHWMSAFAADEEAFASKAVFVEMRLRQALSSSVTLGVPNVFRTAVVCDAFERVAPMTGR
jgi:hypothetical protein